MSAATGRVAEPEPRSGDDVVRGELRGTARGGVLNLAGAACAAMLNFLLVVVVTQAFSKAEAGVFFAATSLFLVVVALGQVGTGTGMVYFLSRARALGAVGHLRGYVRTAAVPVLVLSICLGVTLVVFAPQVAEVSTDGDPGHLAAYLRTLGLFVPVACLTQLGLSATRGLQTMRPSALVDHMARPGLQLLLVAGVAWAAAPSLLVWAWLLPFLPASALVWLWWRRLHARLLARPGQQTDPSSPRGLRGTFWKFTGPRAPALFAQMAMQRLDIVLVAALGGPAEAAVYAAATRFLVLGQMGNQAIATAVQPRIGAALAHDGRVLASRLYGTSTAWLVLVTWPIYLTLAVFGPFLLGVFGEGYQRGSGALLLLSAAMLVATGCGMVDMVLNMAGRTSWTLANTVVALILMLGLDLWLIPELGLLGAAIGWSVSRTVANLVPLAVLGLVLRIHPFGSPLAAAVGAALVSYGGVSVAGRVLLGPTWTGLLVAGTLATVCYLVLLVCLRRPLELAALTALPRSRRRHRG
jgi:O-antigen/teichoic acid export membrane protein